jgi:glycosyltransferase involved in cell wall biosynthesis
LIAGKYKIKINTMEIKRLKLGILFNFSSQWMGGVIYIINIVKTLDYLDDEEKPEIYLFYRPDLKKFINDFNYPYLHFVEWSFPSIVKGNIISAVLRKNVFIEPILNNYSLDAIFPIHDFPVKTRTQTKLISWWADLQHKHYPEFFTNIQILSRNLRAKNIIKNCNHLVVSSKDVLDDFGRFFRISKSLNFHIFHFVSIIDNCENISIHDVKAKYNLPEEYFLVSNQFHKHKNHKILLLALAHLKEKGIIKYIAFTGKLPNAADSPYLSEIQMIIEDNNLRGQVIFLGVISRSEQLQIMRHSQAVIQPSLFEGWSTVIEDAKSLQVPVVASNLKVNKEQLGEDGVYFDPYNPIELATILLNYPARNLTDVFYADYNSRIKEAAKILVGIFKN